MSVSRIRHPGYPPRDRDHGPESARLHPWKQMRMTVEDQLVRAAAHALVLARPTSDRT